MPLVLKYRTGEEIKKGDHVRFHNNSAEVELVACDSSDPEATWHMREFGGGVLIVDPMVSGRTFIPKDQIEECEDLEFVSRGYIAINPLPTPYLMVRYSRSVFSTTIVGNVYKGRTESEISDSTQTAVATVYESRKDGWHVDVYRPLTHTEEDDFNAAVEVAKRSLIHYVNRSGDDAPADATAGGLSLWLMEKDDGTAMGINLRTLETPTQPDDPEAQTRLDDLSPDIADRVLQKAIEVRQLEAIRELRTATGCSLQQAKAWLARK